jgi:hypothetical protein
LHNYAAMAIMLMDEDLKWNYNFRILSLYTFSI